MEQFGKYQLIKRLGAGGMGEVFLAREGQAPPVVLKRILPHLTENPRFLKLFLDETRIAARLQHPNIAGIHELGEADGCWYVAMEYVQGKDLRELTKRLREQGQAVPPAVAVHVMVEVARALEYAHAATDASGKRLKIVHRDVSPHNILLSMGGAVKLIDFGVAKAANKAVHTASGILKGKFPYMAPEQADAKRVDSRTDVFAMGIVLWEMVVGEYLFRGKSDAATLKRVRACEVEPPSSRTPGISAAVDRLALKALRKDPARRYQSARAFREAAEDVLAGLPPPDLLDFMAQLDDVRGLAWADDGLDSEPSDADTVLEAPSEATLHVHDLAQLTRSGRAPEGPRRLLAQVSGVSTNLVPLDTSFVGRVAELADLHQLFRSGVRLLTLLGPGGTGKTRLSQQFASQLVSHFKRLGGAWFCELADARDVDGICDRVARALKVPLSPGADPVSQLATVLAARGELLLVLDNFEQVSAHAAATVERWMEAAPRARVVVSSRELLRVKAEVVFEVPPLRLPERDDEARGSEAVQLFVERARGVRPGWEPGGADLAAVAEVVRQLDGLPLAIELAAARMGVLSPAQLVQRLPRRFELLAGAARGATERQATLRGAIDWSWQMLSPEEQAALAQCAVFRGGFTPEAVTAVVDLAHLPQARGALEVVMSLRARSLVRTWYVKGEETAPRYGLFESIREYAWEKLVALGGEADAVERHARFYLERGGQLSVGADGSAERLDALDVERENLYAVFQRHLAEAVPGVRSLEAVLALDPLLTLRGPFGHHLQMLDAALARPQLEPPAQALALEARGRALQARGKLSEAAADFERAAALATRLGDKGLEGRLLALLGVVDRTRAQRGAARQRFERAFTLLGEVGDRRHQGRALSMLGTLLQDMGLESEAAETFDRALDIHRDVRDRRFEGITLANLGVLQQAQGLLGQAKLNYLAALAIHRELGNRRSEGISHINLGDLDRDLEMPGQAMAHYRSALGILREVGARRFEGHAVLSQGALHHELLEFDEAKAALRSAVEVLEGVGDQRYAGLAQAALAAVEAGSGELARAQERLAAATATLTQVGDPSFLDALDVYRAQLEFAAARAAPTPSAARELDAQVARRMEHAQRGGAPDARHPAGMPSPADRSEHVRSALRALRAVMGAASSPGTDQSG